MCPPSASVHVVYTIDWPSGDHVGWNWYPAAVISLRGAVALPLAGTSTTYSRSSAVNASFVPSGDGTALRICRTVNVDESLTGYSNRTSGPRCCSTSTLNGICAGAAFPVTGTFQIFPLHVATRYFESGVNDMPGYT